MPDNIPDLSVHSISFGEAGRDKTVASVNHLNTWRDWHMVPTSRPVVNPPKPRTNFLTVPGRDGSIDYSEVMGGISFENRTGTWEFAVYHDINESLNISWAQLYSEIMTNLHGRELQVFLEDEPRYFYTGRISVKSWKSDKYYSTVTLEYDLDPYKFTVDRYTVNGLYSDSDEYNWKKYCVWFEFPTPVVSKFCKKPINKVGAYIKFDDAYAQIDKVGFMIDDDDYPDVVIKAAVSGINVSPATFVPFTAYDDLIRVDGYKRPNKLGTEVLSLRNNSFYYTNNLLRISMLTANKNAIPEYIIKDESPDFEVFDTEADLFSYMES